MSQSRAPNAVDFWRGFALVEILINHMPGNFYERFTHRAVSISDSAELFVFLAGWSLSFVAGRPGAPKPAAGVLHRLGWRSATVYGAHVATMMMAIALLAAAALVFDNPLYLEWHNAGPVFQEPIETHIGLVLLSHQLSYFNILPLYVALLAGAPVIALLGRASQWGLAIVSGGLYFAALLTPLYIPTWPLPGQWFFNPLCWQAIFTIGFLAGRDEGGGAWVRRRLPALRLIAWPIVAASAFAVWFDRLPDVANVPWPQRLFIAEKTFLTPMRLIQFLALAVAVSALYPWISRRAGALCRSLSFLGRHSLPVFCAGSIASLIGQILRFQTGGGLAFDTALVVGGLGAMTLAAWAAESREGAA